MSTITVRRTLRQSNSNAHKKGEFYVDLASSMARFEPFELQQRQLAKIYMYKRETKNKGKKYRRRMR